MRLGIAHQRRAAAFAAAAFAAVVAVMLTSGLARPVAAGDGGVVGCGGFVKVSDALQALVKEKVDYSNIQLKLYTGEGMLKYATECAPNGYYFIPIYDRGSFTLAIEGPSGWSFEPATVTVEIGDNNMCNEGNDIDFAFVGFSLTGTVSQGAGCGSSATATGMDDVVVTATATAGGEPLTAAVASDGSYTFDNVFPGTYTVSVAHPSWNFAKTSTDVTVEWDNGVVKDAFVVAGYDIHGLVLSAGEPLRGVELLLHPKGNQKVTSCAPGTKGGANDGGAACVALSGADGVFAFDSVPCGPYSVVPRYRSSSTTFDVEPAAIDLVVAGASVAIEEPFQVMGFNVHGTVVDANGKGLAGVDVVVNGRITAKTSKDGSFELDKVETGTYTITASQANTEFAGLEAFALSPNKASLPPISVSAYDVCGTITVEGLSAIHEVVIASASDDSVVASTRSAADGTFCVAVAPGEYQVAVAVSAAAKDAGLVLAPASRAVNLATGPFLRADFDQSFRAISGSVTCIEAACDPSMTVSLALSNDKSAAKQTAAVVPGTAPHTATFHFDNVVPGAYKLTISKDSWCWESKSLRFSVEDADKDDLSFVQKGYLLTSRLSHDITLLFKEQGAPDADQKSFALTQGTDRFCLLRPGVYELTPESCYRFEQESYLYDTSDPRVLELTATHFRVAGDILVTGMKATEVGKITVKISGTKDVAGGAGATVVEAQHAAAAAGGKSAGGPARFTYDHWAALGDRLLIEPFSDTVLFYPRSRSVAVTESVCPPPLEPFESRTGLFLTGSVTPPVAGAVISVTSDADGRVVRSAETGADGKYRAGPLYDDLTYTLSAARSGYHLRPVEGSKRDFVALKLGSVVVSVVDEAGAPLPSVLLSLSSDSYRSNEATGDDGQHTFGDLAPESGYFLRAMLKEYVFEPAMQSIDVSAGKEVTIAFVGKRVAFSIFGTVTAINGDPEKTVSIEAVGVANSGGSQQQFYEETQTDAFGRFRLRGLNPGTTYDVRVKSSGRFARASPAVHSVAMTAADVEGLSFMAFRQPSTVDITGVVTVDNPEHLSTLTVNLRSDGSDDVVATRELGPLAFFAFDGLPADEYELEITSSLGSFSHKHEALKVPVDWEGESPMCGEARCFLNLTFAIETVSVELEDVAMFPLYTVSFAIIGALVFVYRKPLQAYRDSFKEKPKATGFEVVQPGKRKRGRKA